MTLEPFFRSLPLALPILGGSVLLAVILGGRVGRRWRVGRVVASAYIAVLGSYLAVTATPSRTALDGYSTGARFLNFDLVVPPLTQFTRLTSDALNLGAGVMLGVVSALVWRACASKRWPLLTAVLLPIAVEMFQWAVPALGRIAFLLTDVVINWFGVAIGLVIGLLVHLLWGRLTLLSFAAPAHSERRSRTS